MAAKDDIATIMTFESGKPLKEAQAEFVGGYACTCSLVIEVIDACLLHVIISTIWSWCQAHLKLCLPSKFSSSLAWYCKCAASC